VKLDLIRIAVGVMLGVVGRFLLRQFFVVNADFFLGPLVTVFWRHALRQHPAPSPFKCPQCARTLYDLPN
jgi:hypothetical protein